MPKPSATLLWGALLLLAGFFGTVLMRWPDNFFADDSYFYFQVASRLAHGMGSSFNSLMPTNGYHPLWLLVCTGVLWAVPQHVQAVHAIGAVITVLNLGALVSLTVLLRRAGTSLPWLVWVLYLPFCFTTQLGTEGALSGCMMACTLLLAPQFALRPARWTAGAFALAAGLTVLARLDNIFIISLLSAALVLLPDRAGRFKRLRLLLGAAPLALLLWAAYLYTNHHYFGTWQPISGLLKAHSKGEHRLFSNLPRTAWVDLALVAAGMAVVGRWRRDLFFRVVELPMAFGVVLHALYIGTVLSSETRWSWYYTTWTMLAGLLLARAGSVVFDRWAQRADRDTLRTLVLALTYLLLLAVWWHSSLRPFAHDDATTRDPGFQANVVERAHLGTLLAFDKPGRIAFYSTADLVPLDGLMGNLRFQQELAARGVRSFDRANHVDGFIGPPQPLDLGGKREFCDAVFLSSVQFHCVAAGPGRWTVDRADVFARLTQTPAGSVELVPENLVFNQPGYVAVWRLTPAAGQ